MVFFEKRKFLPWSFITIILTFYVELPPTIPPFITIKLVYGRIEAYREAFLPLPKHGGHGSGILTSFLTDTTIYYHIFKKNGFVLLP